MGKPTICIGENKGADQLRSYTAKLISAFVFATQAHMFGAKSGVAFKQRGFCGADQAPSRQLIGTQFIFFHNQQTTALIVSKEKEQWNGCDDMCFMPLLQRSMSVLLTS